MNEALRIVVADDEADMREYFQRILPRLGHFVVGVASNGQELVDLCREAQPNLAITDIRMPGMDGIQAAEQIYRDRPIPVILVSAYHDPGLIERAEQDHVLAYLIKPIKQADLPPAIAIAMRRFQQFQSALNDSNDMHQALNDRKTIEQATEALMRNGEFGESEALARLRQLADERNRRLIEVARSILNCDSAVSDLPPP